MRLDGPEPGSPGYRISGRILAVTAFKLLVTNGADLLPGRLTGHVEYPEIDVVLLVELGEDLVAVPHVAELLHGLGEVIDRLRVQPHSIHGPGGPFREGGY